MKDPDRPPRYFWIWLAAWSWNVATSLYEARWPLWASTILWRLSDWAWAKWSGPWLSSAWTQYRAGFITLNELRRRHGLEPLKDGDTFSRTRTATRWANEHVSRG